MLRNHLHEPDKAEKTKLNRILFQFQIKITYFLFSTKFLFIIIIQPRHKAIQQKTLINQIRHVIFIDDSKNQQSPLNFTAELLIIGETNYPFGF
jgi:hypothetical protein